MEWKWIRELKNWKTEFLESVDIKPPPNPGPRGYPQEFDLHADHANRKVSRVNKLSRVRSCASHIPESLGKWPFHRVSRISYCIVSWCSEKSNRPQEMTSSNHTITLDLILIKDSSNTLNTSFIYKRNILIFHLVYTKYRYTFPCYSHVISNVVTCRSVLNVLCRIACNTLFRNHWQWRVSRRVWWSRQELREKKKSLLSQCLLLTF